MTIEKSQSKLPSSIGSSSQAGLQTQSGQPAPSLFVKRRVEGNQARESVQRPSISYWQDAWMRIKKNRIAMAAGVFILIVTFLALAVPPFLQYAYDEQEVWNKHALPNLGQTALVIDSSILTYTPVKAPPLAVATPAPVTADPPASGPTNLRILGETLSIGVGLQWDPVEGVDGYRVYRSIQQNTLGIPLADVMADTVSYRDSSGLENGETYYYAVTAYNPFGDSRPSNILQLTPKLALPLNDALKIRSNAKVGDVIQTNPHYLGTDYLGRDMLSRLLAGSRISLFIGVVAPIFFVLFGILFGSISGYFGGAIDNIMMRIADLISTVPDLLIVIMLQVTFGSGPVTLIIALVFSSWAAVSMQIRGEVLRLRETEFVHAAEILGTSFWKIVFRHLLPNVMGTILVLFSISIPRMIFAEAFLSFIGLGIAPPLPSLGSVTREGAKVFLIYPNELLVPGLLLSALVLAFNLFGDGVRDALDPKLRGAK